MITQDNAAEICAVHNSCDGTDGDCRTARGTRPVTTSALPAANDEIGYAESRYFIRPTPGRLDEKRIPA